MYTIKIGFKDFKETVYELNLIFLYLLSRGNALFFKTDDKSNDFSSNQLIIL